MGLIQRLFSGIFLGQTGKVLVLEIGLGLTFTAVVGRYMGPAGYGIYNLIMSIVGLFVIISSFGFAEALGRFVPNVSVESIPLGPIYRFGLIIWLANLVIFALANHLDKILIGYLLKDPRRLVTCDTLGEPAQFTYCGLRNNNFTCAF